MKNLIFVDVESTGPCPGRDVMTEFGAVHYSSRNTFHGVLYGSRPSIENPAIPELTGEVFDAIKVLSDFDGWINRMVRGRPIFISDNPAFDFQWINFYFYQTLGQNPFGYSARRIGDFYAGLVGDFRNAQGWKKLRITAHDHDPVHDALGNAEAFERILNGER